MEFGSRRDPAAAAPPDQRRRRAAGRGRRDDPNRGANSGAGRAGHVGPWAARRRRADGDPVRPSAQLGTRVVVDGSEPSGGHDARAGLHDLVWGAGER